MSTSTEGQSSSNGSLQESTRRTTIFAGVAVACLAITGIFEWLNQPEEIQEFGKVGQEFYPEFTDPTVATSLSVKVVNTDLKPLEFAVKQASNGRWVIPSHHDYPADAAEQLAKTASSVIGIKRDAMVTRWASDHPRYGVVDPETDSVTLDELEGMGKRLTFRGNEDEVLASFIIGKQVEDEDNRYYVRHPAEDETYIAELDIDLSTKFRDWVKTDLLDINATDITNVTIQDYSFEERGLQLALTDTIETKLSRATSADDWKMEGLDEATKQVKADAIRETINTLADLAIAGVRPKQPGLTGDLELDRNVVVRQGDLDRLRADLLARGFFLTQASESDPEKLKLIAREGEMFVGASDGLSYQLHFGRAFTGSDEELEIGFASGSAPASEASSDEDTDSENSDPEASDEAVGEDAEGDEAESETGDSTRPGRYVFIRVQVDPSLLGEKPNPVEPQKSAELIEAEKKAAEASETETEEPAEADESENEAAASESAETEDESSDAESAEEAQAKLQALQGAFAAAQQKYAADQQALTAYEEKLKAAEEKATELNRRFGQWYYVIPGDEYDKLSLKKDDLIEAKEAEDGTPVGEPTPELQLNLPSAGNPGLPIQIPSTPDNTETEAANTETEGDTKPEGGPDSDGDAKPEGDAKSEGDAKPEGEGEGEMKSEEATETGSEETSTAETESSESAEAGEKASEESTGGEENGAEESSESSGSSEEEPPAESTESSGEAEGEGSEEGPGV